MGKKRVFIYGSCVSRDTFEFLSSDDIVLTGYVARQSLISVNRDSLSYWPENFALKSNFQNRMVHSDWAGDALVQIEAAATEGLDALVLDFTDERFGVYEFEPQAIVTRTTEIMGTPLEEVASEGTLHELGSEQHFSWFRWCLDLLAARLKELGLFEKTIVLQVPWAAQTDDGEQLPERLGLTPARANELYEPYYRLVADTGFTVIDLSNFQVRAEPLHQWGLAPYHYTIDVYQEIAHELRVFLGI